MALTKKIPLTPVWEIDLGALQSNARLLKKLSGENFFCPMIKTDAYGHGLVPVAKALCSAGIQQVGVGSVSEARQIRKALSARWDILVFHPVLNWGDMSWLYENRCVPVINNWRDLKLLAKTPSPRLHIKFDTGFSRLGFPPAEAEALKSFFRRQTHFRVEGICSHLTNNEESANRQSPARRQVEKMKSLAALFPGGKNHLYNTAGLFSRICHSRTVDFGVRPGIGLFGVRSRVVLGSKAAERRWNALPLKPVSTLKGRVTAFCRLKKGETVSYNGTWRAKRPSVTALVSLGYGDGFPRLLSSPGGRALFRGKIFPVAGRVCMDFFMLDVTAAGAPPPSVGEEVVIFGKQKGGFLSPEFQAEQADTLPHELFVRLKGRVRKKYIVGPEKSPFS